MFHVVTDRCFACKIREMEGYTLKDLHEATPGKFWCCRAVSTTYKLWGRLYYDIDPHLDRGGQEFVCNNCHRELDILKSLDWLRKSAGSLP